MQEQKSLQGQNEDKNIRR